MNGTLKGVLQIAGVSMPANISRTEIGGEGHEPPLAAGVVGVLTTRSTDTTGLVTAAGFTTGDIIGISWIDPTTGSRFAMVGFTTTVAGSAVTFEHSATDFQSVFPAATVLPDALTAVVVSKKTVSDFSATHGDITFSGVNCDQPAVGVFGLLLTPYTAIYPTSALLPTTPVLWDKATGATSPWTADVTGCACYNFGTVAATFQYAVLLKS